MYMKRILTILASVAMVMAAVSCETEQTPSLSFGKSHYVLLADAPLTVELTTDIAPAADLTVELSFTGEAVEGTDYSVSAKSVVIPAGQVSGSITITPENNYTADKSIVISMILPAGYEAGDNATATVAVEAKEVLLYSFAVDQANVVDRYVVKLELSGMSSGDEWVATTDMEIPYKVSPEPGNALVLADDVFVVAKGTNVATLVVNAGEIEGDPQEFVITVDEEAAGVGFSSGDKVSTTLTVSGLLKISSLLGTWEYNELILAEEYEFFYDPAETGDDFSLMPINNEGFKLTFYEAYDDEANLVYKVKPEGTGDWNNYFRDAVIDYRSPINYDADAEITGPYSAIEYNMFTTTMHYDEEPMVYFSLDKVNRAFSPSKETIGEGAISMWVDADGLLVVNLKDYDMPPFANYWWVDPSDGSYGDNFAEMFSFASTFVKAE